MLERLRWEWLYQQVSLPWNSLHKYPEKLVRIHVEFVPTWPWLRSVCLSITFVFLLYRPHAPHARLPPEPRISADLLHDDRADELHKLFDRELLRGKSGRSGACADGCLSPRSWRRRLDLARRQPS